MRDRLIDLIESVRYWGANTSAEIADHLLANGVIVPPCKVGDSVYYFSTLGVLPFINKAKIKEISIGVKTIKCFFDKNKYFAINEFGKTVFLTKEEAEKALSERRANDET